jgi:hypothetical protein
MRELVIDAWAMCAPRRDVAAYAARDQTGTASRSAST